MNVRRKILKNKKGFSLMEMVVAVGITGVVSLGVLQMTDNQNKIQNYGKSKSAEQSLVNDTKLSLLTSLGCSASLVNTTIPNPPAEASIPEIRDASGRVVMRTTDRFGDKNNIIVSAISIAAISPPVEGDNLVSLNLTTTREIQGEADKSFTNSILLRVNLDSANRITNCFSSVGPLADNLGEQFCLSTGGAWTAGANTCAYTCPASGAGLQNQAVNSSCILSRETTDYDPNYLTQNGNNTVSGNLTISGADLVGTARVTSRSPICINGVCRDFSAEECSAPNPNDQKIMRGIQTSGGITCYASALACSSTQYYRGINTSGVICEPVPLEQCTNANYFIREIQSNGTIVCEPIPTNSVAANPGNYINRISAAGSPTYSQDRYLQAISCPAGQYITRATNGSASCSAINDTNVFGQSCPAGEVVTGFDSAGVIECIAVAATPTCTPVHTPLPSTQCSGVSFTQTNQCDSTTRPATGTSTTGACAPPPPPTFSCTDSVPANASGCSVSGLTSDKAYVHANTCSGGADRCEFSCNSGYAWNGSACAANSGFDCEYAASTAAFVWPDTDNNPVGWNCHAEAPVLTGGLNEGQTTVVPPLLCRGRSQTTGNQEIGGASGSATIICSGGTLQLFSQGPCECDDSGGGF